MVYYLVLSPVTVKIGTTINLRQRMSALRTEMQYVIALEPGGRELERKRHLQFKDERRGHREDFTLSDALKRHIDELAPHRDEILTRALGVPAP